MSGHSLAPLTRRMAALTVLAVLLGPVAEAQAGSLVAGVAVRDITPEARVPLAGYSRRKGKLAEGVHDRVFAKALVLRDDDTRVAIVGCDLLIIDELLFDAVRDRLHRQGFDPSAILLIAATHTHSGPGAYGRRFFEKISMGHFQPAVFDGLVSGIAGAILDASKQTHPVTVSLGSTTTEGLVVNRMNADGLADAQLTVLALWTSPTTPLAVVANFAAHPTTLGAWNREISADYPGVLASAVEARYPGSVCLFLPGAVGDQAPAKQGSGFDRARLIGEPLGAKTIELLGRAAPEAPEEASVSAQQRVETLAPAQLRLGRLRVPSWIGRSFVDDDATLTLVTIGKAALMGVPCDLSAELGAELKRRAAARGYQGIVVGFADDYIGYCLPKRLYQTNQYEASMAFNGPGTGEQLVERLGEMLDALPTPAGS